MTPHLEQRLAQIAAENDYSWPAGEIAHAMRLAAAAALECDDAAIAEATTKHQDGLLVETKGQYDKLRTERNVVQMELDQITEYSAELESDNDKLRARVAELEPRHECACGMCKMHKDVAKIKADAVREAFEELQAYMSNKTFGTSTPQKDDFNFFMGGVSQAINVMKNHMRDVLKANQIEGGES